jgi:hypothetical protein
MKKEARMPPAPSDGDDAPPKTSVWTLAELFYGFRDPRYRQQLEDFRIQYESQFGETDLTRRWTSNLPTDQQEWLQNHHPKRYWDGLPPFVQAFFKEKFRQAHKKGNLDDMPAKLLSLYLRGQMEVGDDGRYR